MAPQVRYCGGRAIGVLHSDGNHNDANDDQGDDCDDLDHGKPEFGFAEGLNRHGVERKEQEGGCNNRDPRGKIRPPEMDVTGDGDNVCNTGNDPAQPVGPAHDKTHGRAKEVADDIGEGPVLAVRQKDLAHSAHEQEQCATDDEVHQENRGTRCGNGLTRAHEKARTDCAADSDELNVAIRQVALELAARGLTTVLLSMSAGAHVGPFF